MLAVCPACDSVVESESPSDTVESHNDSLHDGEQVAQVIEGNSVDPDTVDDLVDTARQFTSEQHERFIRTVMGDPRFEVMEGDEDAD